MTAAIDFEGINSAALRVARSLIPDLVPGGKFRGLEYLVKNPTRDDKQAGSFSINYRSGVWAEFAGGRKETGSDLISLVAYLRGVGQGDAARALAEKLGVSLKANGFSANSQANGKANGHAAVGPEVSSASDAPRVCYWGDDGAPKQADEVRRHTYISADVAKRIKIKFKDGRFSNWYRIFADGEPIGWQAKKPDHYQPIPYVTNAIDPFDPELIADEILWVEGEKDIDTVNRKNLPGFTFGGVGDGLPDGTGHYLKDRRIVILADNDEPGRVHAEKKAIIAHGAGAVSIKIVHFPELAPKCDVSDFFANGATAEQLIARIDATPVWSPSSTPAPATNTAVSELVIKRASEITPQPVMWLWPGRIAIGKLTLIAGEPGLGKSQIATALVAAVTTGGQWPHQEGRAPLGNAIILSAEDGVADTIVPRLHAAQANCERAYIISAVRNHDRLRTFNLQADLALLEQTIDRIGDVRLVVIDPISSYMGASIATRTPMCVVCWRLSAR